MPDRRRIVLYRDRQGAWRFRVVAGNGEIIATGEGYTRKWSAKRAATNLWPTLPITVDRS